MEAIEVGFISILPPIIAIILALITKEVISSLLIGIFSGTLIYSFYTGGGIIKAIQITFLFMAEKISENIFVIIFLALLGALVVTITSAGGSYAYGIWVSSKIKSKRSALVSTALLGIMIFIDDYFNCITLGTVMQPVTDKQNVSRAKLSYIVHSMAPTICILVPVSSWAASVISHIDSTGLNGMPVFILTISCNLYAILTIVMVFAVSIFNLDFGSMLKYENRGLKNNNIIVDNIVREIEDDNIIKASSKGTVYDLIIPVLSLVIISILSMLYQGGYFTKNISFSQALSSSNASLAITYGAFISLIIAFIMFIPRKLLKFKEFMDCISQGTKSMVPAFIILSLAWTIGGICKDLIGTGNFVGDLVVKSNIPVIFIPCIAFALAGALAFAIGTSWGTFGILIPIVAMICERVGSEMVVIALSAVLSGAVFGDHASPISDTAILSSTSTGCNHMEHISSQMPYAILVAVIAFLGYFILGITCNALIALPICILLLLASMFMLNRISKSKISE